MRISVFSGDRGVEFIDENGGGLGVRLWHRQQKERYSRLTEGG